MTWHLCALACAKIYIHTSTNIHKRDRNDKRLKSAQVECSAQSVLNKFEQSKEALQRLIPHSVFDLHSGVQV